MQEATRNENGPPNQTSAAFIQLHEPWQYYSDFQCFAMTARSDIGIIASVSIHPLKVDCPMFSPRGVRPTKGMCMFSSREAMHL